MEGREVMASYTVSAPYYLQQRGVNVDVSGGQSSGLVTTPSGFIFGSNQGSVVQSGGHGSPGRQGFQMDLSNSRIQHNVHLGSSSQGGTVKKKRGRPRKYAPDDGMGLVLTPMSDKGSQGGVVSSEKRKRGRPLGSGRKQKLASIGGWMNSSAGLAFAPHVLAIAEGEDIASRILLFSQQRPRAICIMSGSGTVSSVSLRQPASSSNIVTYEGHFQILCLSGSYLVSEEGGPSRRIGGLNISLSTPEGHVLGGVIGGPLIAASLVQVVTCSFVFDISKAKINSDEPPKAIKHDKEEGEPSTETDVKPNQNPTPTNARNSWPSSQPLDLRNPPADIDLMLG